MKTAKVYLLFASFWLYDKIVLAVAGSHVPAPCEKGLTVLAVTLTFC